MKFICNFLTRRNNKLMMAAHILDAKKRTSDISDDSHLDFESLLLSPRVLEGLKKCGFVKPSPIQVKALPLAKCGVDLVCQAKSGTGKTCVFAVCALETVDVQLPVTQVLVLAPTREIAHQIHGVVSSIGSCMPSLECGLFIGGISLRIDLDTIKNCHIAVGTPGRIRHLIEKGNLQTSSIRLFVLDEADKLLEKGSFEEQINWIYSTLSRHKQVLALSATYPEQLAAHLNNYMQDAIHVRIQPNDVTLKGVKQYFVEVNDLRLANKTFDLKCKVVLRILRNVPFQQCMIFSNYHSRAEHLSRKLNNQGYTSTYIAGSQVQSERLEAIAKLKEYNCRILITTDLTSRGIDCDKVNLVINLDLPWDVETYFHRIGRSGRFGSYGIAISFVGNSNEREKMKEIERMMGKKISQLPRDDAALLHLWELTKEDELLEEKTEHRNFEVRKNETVVDIEHDTKKEQKNKVDCLNKWNGVMVGNESQKTSFDAMDKTTEPSLLKLDDLRILDEEKSATTEGDDKEGNSEVCYSKNKKIKQNNGSENHTSDRSDENTPKTNISSDDASKVLCHVKTIFAKTTENILDNTKESHTFFTCSNRQDNIESNSAKGPISVSLPEEKPTVKQLPNYLKLLNKRKKNAQKPTSSVTALPAKETTSKSISISSSATNVLGISMSVTAQLPTKISPVNATETTPSTVSKATQPPLINSKSQIATTELPPSSLTTKLPQSPPPTTKSLPTTTNSPPSPPTATNSPPSLSQTANSPPLPPTTTYPPTSTTASTKLPHISKASTTILDSGTTVNQHNVIKSNVNGDLTEIRPQKLKLPKENSQRNSQNKILVQDQGFPQHSPKTRSIIFVRNTDKFATYSDGFGDLESSDEDSDDNVDLTRNTTSETEEDFVYRENKKRRQKQDHVEQNQTLPQNKFQGQQKQYVQQSNEQFQQQQQQQPRHHKKPHLQVHSPSYTHTHKQHRQEQQYEQQAQSPWNQDYFIQCYYRAYHNHIRMLEKYKTFYQ